MGKYIDKLRVYGECELVTVTYLNVSYTTAHYYFGEQWRSELGDNVNMTQISFE